MKTSLIFLLILITSFTLVNIVGALELSPLSLNTQNGQITSTTFTVRASQPVTVSTDSPLVSIDKTQLNNGTNTVIVKTDFTNIGPNDPAVLGIITFTEAPPQQAASVSISNAIQLYVKNNGGTIVQTNPTITTTPTTTQESVSPVQTTEQPVEQTPMPVIHETTLYLILAILLGAGIVGYFLFVHRFKN